MNKNNSKEGLKIVNAKLSNPFSTIRTPVHNNSGLFERVMNITSPSTTKKQLCTERKVVSIDLKQERKENSAQHQGKQQRKVLKLRRKTESVDKVLTASSSKTGIGLCSSQKQLSKNQSTNLLNPRLKCFDELNSYELCNDLRDRDRANNEPKTSRLQSNWQEIIDNKKQQLYSQIYKMDKKIFSMERDLDNLVEMSNKKSIVEMIKRKTTGQRVNHAMAEIGTPIAPIQIHTNIYKAGKNRIS